MYHLKLVGETTDRNTEARETVLCFVGIKLATEEILCSSKFPILPPLFLIINLSLFVLKKKKFSIFFFFLFVIILFSLSNFQQLFLLLSNLLCNVFALCTVLMTRQTPCIKMCLDL